MELASYGVYLFLAALLGIIPGTIARNKGHSFIAWWVYGVLLFIAALPHSLLIKTDPEGLEYQNAKKRLKKCFFCGEWIQSDARICRFCGKDTTSLTKACDEGWVNGPVVSSQKDPELPSGSPEVPITTINEMKRADNRTPPSRSSPSAIGILGIVLAIASLFVPYIAAIFLVPVAFACGIISLVRREKVIGISVIVLSIIGSVWIVYVSNQIQAIIKNPFASNPLIESSQVKPVVTMKEYLAIKDGMSYQEVVRIIGASGVELSRSDIAGFTTVMYEWSNENGSSMNAMFQNNQLSVKSQFGLQ